MKPRILQIISTRDSAGVEKQLRLLARRLPRDQFDLHICFLAQGATGVSAVQGVTATHERPCCSSPMQPNMIGENTPVTFISTRSKYDPKAFWELNRLVARFKPILLHAWTSDANIYGFVASKAMDARHYVAGYYSVNPFKSGLRRMIDRHIGKHSAQLTVNNAGVRDFYVQEGLPAEKIRIIPSGVEPQRPSTTTRRQLLDDLKLPENSRIIGLVSGLLSRNRLKDAVWAADLLKVVRKDVHLLIIGDGPDRDQLRRFRDQVRIADLVHFLGPRNDLDRLMPHLDLLWSTAPYDNPSDFILEAMAAGVPVVAGDNCHTRDLVIPGQTGFLVSVGDRAGLARYTHQLLEDSPLSIRLGQTARERAQKAFSIDQFISRHVQMYREIIG